MTTRRRVVVDDDEPIVNGRRGFGDSLPAELLEYAEVYEDDQREFDQREKRDSAEGREAGSVHRGERGW